jgi:hypothetical protein
MGGTLELELRLGNGENPFGIGGTMGYLFSGKPTLWGLIGLIIKDGQNGVLNEL